MIPLVKNKLRLSSNFYANEFAVSETRQDLADLITCNDYEMGILKLLCQTALQPIRDEFKKQETIKILSGVRSKQLNDAIGGSNNSDHMFYCAADITTPRLNEKYMWAYYNLSYKELIIYPDKNFFHISINIPGRQYQNQAFIKYKNDTYIPYKGGNVEIKEL